VIEGFDLSPTLGNVVMAIYCAATWELGRNIREQIQAAVGWLTDEIDRRSPAGNVAAIEADRVSA
jgi:hypothetical protein